MSDARWLDVADDLAAASLHFRNARALHAEGHFDDAGLAGYRDAMALMHALQAGHTSAEAALVRILRILGEDAPSGDDWHRKLIERLSKRNGTVHARPALLSRGVAADLDETRRFRNLAMRSYGTFDVARVNRALEAAGRLADSLAAQVAAFKATLDPD